MTIDLTKLGELQKLAAEIDSSKDGDKSGRVDTEKEISANPRARSAKLRFAVKKRLERNPGDE